MDVEALLAQQDVASKAFILGVTNGLYTHGNFEASLATLKSLDNWWVWDRGFHGFALTENP